jgi:hypothetical protein
MIAIKPYFDELIDSLSGDYLSQKGIEHKPIPKAIRGLIC